MIKVNGLKAWFLAARPKTLTGACAPVLIGGGLAMFFLWMPGWLYAMVSALSVSLLVLVIRDALANTRSLYINIVYNPLYTLLLWLGMIVLFALTVLFPISSLKKMKISEQIKCD